MAKGNLLILVFLLLTKTLLGQCPDRVSFRIEIKKVRDLPYPKQIPAYLQLQKRAIQCKIDDDSTYTDLLFGLSGMYYYTQNFKEAIRVIKQSIELCNKNYPKTSLARLPAFYLYLGTYQYQANEYKEAIESLEKSITHGKKVNQYSHVVNSQQILAGLNYYLGDYEKSIRYTSEGLYYAKFLSVNKEPILHRLYYEKSKAHEQLNNYPLAIEAIKNAIDCAKKYTDNKIDLGYGYLFQGTVYSLNKSKYPEAEKAFFDSIRLFDTLKDTANIGFAYGNLGYLYYRKLNNFDKGLYYTGKAFQLSRNFNDKARYLNNIGMIYYLKQDYLNALRYYQKALNTFPLQFKDSLFTANPTVNSLKNTGYKEYLLSILQDKALCWLEYYKATKNQSHLKNALSTYLLADKIIDFMRWEHSGNQSKLFWRNKTRSIYEQAIETCYLLKDYEKAFYFFEKSRAVLLNDKLNELGAKQALSEADRAKEIQLQSRIDELRKKSETDKNKIEQTERELLMAENAQNDFIKNLEKTNPAYYNFKYNTKTDSIKQVQRYLKSKGSTLIEYFVGDSLTYAIVVSPTAVKIQTLLFDPNDTQTYLRLCAKDISTKTELNEFLAVSNRLYRNLIAPLNLSKGHLIISQDGAFLPFEALSLSASKPGSYLLNEQAISYTYSAQFLLKNQPSSHFLPQKSFLGVAPVQFSQKLNTLTGSAESIGRIGGTYLWKNELVHQKATKSAFLNQASGHRIVQVYTHAFADSTQTEPHIYFADSALKVSDLGNAFFKINLLVLSACKTGVGKVAKGEGVLSLARGFSMAGIPSTITTLWSVEDQTTYALTELFYTFLNEGLSKDEALQKAKRQYISMHPNAAPAAWAGLVLIGDAVALPSNTLWWWGLGGLAVLLIIGGVFMKRSFSVKH